LAFAEGLFYFLFEKEGFLKIMQYNEYIKFSKVNFINNKKIKYKNFYFYLKFAIVFET